MRPEFNFFQKKVNIVKAQCSYKSQKSTMSANADQGKSQQFEKQLSLINRIRMHQVALHISINFLLI